MRFTQINEIYAKTFHEIPRDCRHTFWNTHCIQTHFYCIFQQPHFMALLYWFYGIIIQNNTLWLESSQLFRSVLFNYSLCYSQHAEPQHSLLVVKGELSYLFISRKAGWIQPSAFRSSQLLFFHLTETGGASPKRKDGIEYRFAIRLHQALFYPGSSGELLLINNSWLSAEKSSDCACYSHTTIPCILKLLFSGKRMCVQITFITLWMYIQLHPISTTIVGLHGEKKCNLKYNLLSLCSHFYPNWYSLYPGVLSVLFLFIAFQLTFVQRAQSTAMVPSYPPKR